jgi:hypothetical protein
MAERGYCYDRAVSRGAWQFARSYLAAEADGAKRAAESARAASDDADESDMADDPGSPSPPRPGSRPFDASYLARKPRDYPFPYAFVRPLASRDHLYGRFLDAARSEERVSCLGSDCAACGACDDGERTFLSGHRLDDAGSGDIEDVMSLMAAKRRPHETWLRGAVTFEAAAAPPAYAAALFRCGLYAAVPQLLETVWTVEDAFIKSASGLERLPGAWGDTWYRALSSAPLRAETLVAAGYVVSLAAPSVERVSIELVFIGASVPEAVRLVSDYLAAATIPCTLAKSGGEARYIVSDKGLKKRNVLAASLAPREDGTAVASLSCGAKHDLGPLAALAAKRRIRLDVRVRLDASPRP